MKDPCLTITEVAEKLRISESMVRKAVASGRLVAMRFGRRVVFLESDVDAYMEASRTKKLKEPA